MQISIKGNRATVVASAQVVIALGMAFCRALDPNGYMHDKNLPTFLKKWETGTGEFEIGHHFTKKAFTTAVSGCL